MRFIRPEGEGTWGVFIGGSESWFRKGTITLEDGRYRAMFRDVPIHGDLGLYDTLTGAALAMADASKVEGEVIAEQVAEARAHGWTLD